MGSLTFSLQIVLVCCGIISLALFMKLSVPLVIEFSVYQAPLIWTSLSSWLKPPYLYVILNCIIITIAASSRFHHNKGERDLHAPPKISPPEPDHQFSYETSKISASPEPEVQMFRPDYGGLEEEEEEEEEVTVPEVEKVTAADAFEDKNTVVVNGYLEVEDEFVISKSMWNPPKRSESSENIPDLLLLPAEKPLVSARFGHRRPVRATPEGGRALRVAKPKRNETLENTWKMITEGRAMPLTRHLKKSETFNDNDHDRPVNAWEADPRIPRKSETFKDRTNYQLPPVGSNGNSPASSGGKLRKEPSLGQDELNRRVEAFIKKFNDEMRMQRQESMNQYKEMISRGA